MTSLNFEPIQLTRGQSIRKWIKDYNTPWIALTILTVLLFCGFFANFLVGDPMTNDLKARQIPPFTDWSHIFGTDILGTMVNTLLFAYIGVRILLLMAIIAPDLRNSLFASPVVELLSIGITSAEILRLLAGTLGLVLVIPITAIISAFWHQRS